MGQLVEIADHLAGKKREAFLLMARGMSCREISEQTGLAVQTLYNWRSADPAFRSELARLQRDLYDEGVGALRGLVQDATATLCSVMSNPAARDVDRIGAARTVLQLAMSAQDGRSPDVDEDDREFRDVADELARLVRTGNAS